MHCRSLKRHPGRYVAPRTLHGGPQNPGERGNLDQMVKSRFLATTTGTADNPPYVITCVSTDLVRSSCHTKITKQYDLKLPYYGLHDCTGVSCTIIPNSEKIMFLNKQPTKRPHVYRVYIKLTVTAMFTLYCPSGNVHFTQELTIASRVVLTLLSRDRVKVKVVPICCNCCLKPGETRITRLYGEKGVQFAFCAAFNNRPSSVVVGAPPDPASEDGTVGEVTVFSDETYKTLFKVSSFYPNDDFGFAVDAGYDLNGDGWSDILVGAPGTTINSARWAGYIYVVSGLDGSKLLEIQNTEPEAQFGWSVNWAGDLDGDHVPDILVGAPSASPGGKINAGSVFVYDGASGKLIYRLDGQNAGDAFGYALKNIGDVDGDGVPDFAVGAPFASPGGLYQAGVVYAFSGATGALIYTIDGGEENAGLGFSLDVVSDINGDGFPEILVGAPGSSPGGRKDAGSVYIFSGADGRKLFHFAGPVSGEEVGIAVACTGYRDPEGKPVLALGAPSASVAHKRFIGAVYLVSSGSGQILGVLKGDNIWAQYGWSVAGPGLQASPDLFLMGAPGSRIIDVGQLTSAILRCEIQFQIIISVLHKVDILIPVSSSSSLTEKCYGMS